MAAAVAPENQSAAASNAAAIFSPTIRQASCSTPTSPWANFSRRRQTTSQDSIASIALAYQGKPESEPLRTACRSSAEDASVSFLIAFLQFLDGAMNWIQLKF